MKEFECIIEAQGEHRGVPFLVLFLDIGHRCCYVKMPEDLLNKKQWTNESLDEYLGDNSPHGGVTFFGPMDEPGVNPKETYIGFDAMHGNDLIDGACLEKYFNTKKFPLGASDDLESRRNDIIKLRNSARFPGAKIRTKEYMVDECIKLIDSLKQKLAKNREYIRKDLLEKINKEDEIPISGEG